MMAYRMIKKMNCGGKAMNQGGSVEEPENYESSDILDSDTDNDWPGEPDQNPEGPVYPADRETLLQPYPAHEERNREVMIRNEGTSRPALKEAYDSDKDRMRFLSSYLTKRSMRK